MTQAMVVTNAPTTAAAPSSGAGTPGVSPVAGGAAQAAPGVVQGNTPAPGRAGEGGQPVRGPDGKFTKAEAKAEAAKEPEAPSKPSKVKLLNGKELDLEEVVRLATKQAAGEDKFRAAAEKEKALTEVDGRIKALFAAMDQDPDGFATELSKLAKARGVSPEKLATKMLQPLIEAEMLAAEEKSLTPEQLETRKLKRELDELKRAKANEEAAAKKAAEEKAQAEHQAQVQKLSDDYAEKIQAALEKSKLPKTPETALTLVNLAKELRARDIEVTPDALAAELADMKRAEWLAVQEMLGEDTSWISPKVLESARKAELAKLKEKNPFANAAPKSSKKAGAKPDEQPKQKSMDAIKRDLMMGIGVRKPA